MTDVKIVYKSFNTYVQIWFGIKYPKMIDMP